MSSFFVILVGSLIAIHAYFIWSLRRAFGKGLWQIIPAAVMLLIAAGFFLDGFTPKSSMGMLSYVWFAFLLFAVMFLAARDVLAFVARLGSRLAGWRLPVLLVSSKSIVLALLLAVPTLFYAMAEARSIQLRHHEIPTSLLPENVEKVRIVALTDLHLIPGRHLASLDRIVDMVNAQNPDIVALIGDVVDGNFSNAVAETKRFRKIEAKAGKFAVVGNHEIFSGLAMANRFLENAGFTVLRGEATEAAGIQVAGVDDPLVRARAGIVETLTKADAATFVLLLSHRPDVPAEAAGRFDLEIAGHTHGGQIWPGRYLARLLNGFGQGFTAIVAPDGRPRQHSLLYVSNGTRQWGPPARFLAPPEITVFDLVRQD